MYISYSKFEKWFCIKILGMSTNDWNTMQICKAADKLGL